MKKLTAKRHSDGHFKCTECDYKTTRLYNCEGHFRTHTDEKPFQCRLCEKAFRNRTACISHIRMHDDRFKLKCSFCDAQFLRHQTLIRHTQREHNGEVYARQRRIFETDRRKRNKYNLNTFCTFNFDFWWKDRHTLKQVVYLGTFSNWCYELGFWLDNFLNQESW